MKRAAARAWRPFLVVLPLLLPFGARSADALPAAPMTERVAHALLQLAKAGPADRVVALVPGDAGGLGAAARRSGVKSAHVAAGPEEADLPSASVVVLHLAPEAALRIRPLLLVGRPGTRAVSLEAGLGDWKPDRTVAIDIPSAGGAPGRKANAYLWTIPSNMNGEWCGQDAASGTKIRLDQRFQEVEGDFRKATKSLRFEGRIEGTRIAAAAGRLALEQSGDILRVTIAQGNYAAYRFASFARTCCGTCP